MRIWSKKISKTSICYTSTSTAFLHINTLYTWFRIFLSISFSDMKHKAKSNCQHQIKSPWNKAPVKQRIYTCPILNTSHLCQMRIGCIQYPFRERVEQYICAKATGKHHGAPCEEGILRLLILLTKDDVTVLRTGNIQRKDCLLYTSPSPRDA